MDDRLEHVKDHCTKDYFFVYTTRKEINIFCPLMGYSDEFIIKIRNPLLDPFSVG